MSLEITDFFVPQAFVANIPAQAIAAGADYTIDAPAYIAGITFDGTSEITIPIGRWDLEAIIVGDGVQALAGTFGFVDTSNAAVGLLLATATDGTSNGADHQPRAHTVLSLVAPLTVKIRKLTGAAITNLHQSVVIIRELP